MQLPLAILSKTHWLTAVAIVASGWMSGDFAQAADRANWATGAELQKRLAQPVDIVWLHNPLRNAAAGISRTQRVAILIDRRVDPGKKLDITLKDTPLKSVLQTIADRCGMEVVRLKDVIYFGPTEAAAQLRPVAAAFSQEARRLPKAAQRKYFQSKPMAWADLSTPRDLLAELGRQNDIEIAGLQQIPHDLWAAANLPPMTLVDRLSLIAIQFDLGFEITANGARLKLVPLSAINRTEKTGQAL